MRRILGHLFHQVAVDELDPIVVEQTRDLFILFDRQAVEDFRRVDHARDRMSGSFSAANTAGVPTDCDVIVDMVVAP